MLKVRDGNKTKTIRSGARSRPVKQQQKCITEKITWCKNVIEVMTSNVWHCICIL